MSQIQWQEEQDYDTESEYLNVLRQEAYDPYADEPSWDWWTPEDEELTERVGLGEFEEH